MCVGWSPEPILSAVSQLSVVLFSTGRHVEMERRELHQLDETFNATLCLNYFIVFCAIWCNCHRYKSQLCVTICKMWCDVIC